MVSLPRVAAVLGGSIEELGEAHFQHAVDEHVPEHFDLDWKRDMYEGSDAGKKELAKDVAAMANTGGGLVVVGVDDAKQDHAARLAPVTKLPGRSEEWMRSVLSNWVQPVVPGVRIRWIPSTGNADLGYWAIAVPQSTTAPHAVLGNLGNDMSFRFPVRHGTTTRTLSESEIANHYRNRFEQIAAERARIQALREEGDADLNEANHWVAVALVPAARGSLPMTTRSDRLEAFRAAVTLADRCFSHQWPSEGKPGRRRMRFAGTVSGHLHQDGSAYLAYRQNIQTTDYAPQGPRRLYLGSFELGLLTIVQGAAAWAVHCGATGDATISAHCVSPVQAADELFELMPSADSFGVSASAPLSAQPVEITVSLDALATSAEENVVAAHTLASDLLADIGMDEPTILNHDGTLHEPGLGQWRSQADRWKRRWDSN